MPTSTGGFGASVEYQAPTSTIDPAIAKDFDLKTVANVADMEKAYGFKFTAAERKSLADNKFVMKNLLDTNIRPAGYSDTEREFVQLYSMVKGQNGARDRGPQNALF
jgi:hypothetical protein